AVRVSSPSSKSAGVSKRKDSPKVSPSSDAATRIFVPPTSNKIYIFSTTLRTEQCPGFALIRFNFWLIKRIHTPEVSKQHDRHNGTLHECTDLLRTESIKRHMHVWHVCVAICS